MTKLTTYTVTADEEDVRLDRWFKRHFPSLSHSMLQKLLRTGQVRVDGKRAEASTRLKAQQSVRVPPQVKTAVPPEVGETNSRHARKLSSLILYEDDDVLVLNKPAGLAVQGGTGLKQNLDDMLQSLSLPGQGKPKLVHRLDRDTSGVLLVARTPFAATHLAAAFRERETQKIYWGLCLNVPRPKQGKIEIPLIKQGERMIEADFDDRDAKEALTLYKVIENKENDAAFVAMWPITGRTHQLRVHMAAIGCPLMGDPLYGDENSTIDYPIKELGRGLHLHARRLIVPHPRQGVIDVVAPLGSAMQQSFRWFGFDANATTEFDSKKRSQS